MKPAIVRQAGGPDVITIEMAAEPVPKEGEVLVRRVAASGFVKYAHEARSGGRTLIEVGGEF